MAIIHAEDHGRKAPAAQETRVCFLLDATGSMTSAKSQVISGFNEYVQTLKAKTDNVVLTLVQFNSEIGVETVYADKPITDAPTLDENDYRPDGMTPLYDAIGSAISLMGHTGERVLFVIQTDGEENVSKEYSLGAVRQLIKAREELGWTFVYMGADQDAWEVGGKSLGLSRGNTLSYGSAQIQDTFTNLASATVSYCSSVSSSEQTTGFFSETEGDTQT